MSFEKDESDWSKAMKRLHFSDPTVLGEKGSLPINFMFSKPDGKKLSVVSFSEV